MANGWVKLHRKILEWEFYNDMPVRSVFIHLLLTAEFDTVECHGITVQRGQMITTLAELMDCLGITKKQVRRALSDLQAHNQITIVKTHRHMILTVVNYDSYQDSASDTQNQGHAKGHANRKKRARNTTPQVPLDIDNYDDEMHNEGTQTPEKGHAKGHTYTIDKKEERKEESVHAAHCSFEVFWDLYDKKLDRYKCEKLWAALNDDDKAAIIEHVPRYVASCPEAQYRKNPQTYLNGKCWNDDIIFRGNHAHNSTTRRSTATATPSRGTGSIADYIANERQWGFASSVASEPNFRQTGS